MNHAPPVKPLPVPPARRALANPRAGSATVTAGQVLTIGGALYQLAVPISGAPTLMPLVPLAVNLGDRLQIGAATYQVLPSLVLSLLPPPVPPMPGAGPVISGYRGPDGQPVHTALPGEVITILGSGFGTGGTVIYEGQPLSPLSWIDTRIDVPLTVAGPPVGAFTIVPAAGGYYSGLAFPVNAP